MNHRLLAYVLSAFICTVVGWKLTGSTQAIPLLVLVIHAGLFFRKEI